eukprot:419695-Rhodomonas_salina.1
MGEGACVEERRTLIRFNTHCSATCLATAASREGREREGGGSECREGCGAFGEGCASCPAALAPARGRGRGARGSLQPQAEGPRPRPPDPSSRVQLAPRKAFSCSSAR